MLCRRVAWRFFPDFPPTWIFSGNEQLPNSMERGWTIPLYGRPESLSGSGATYFFLEGALPGDRELITWAGSLSSNPGHIFFKVKKKQRNCEEGAQHPVLRVRMVLAAEGHLARLKHTSYRLSDSLCVQGEGQAGNSGRRNPLFHPEGIHPHHCQKKDQVTIVNNRGGQRSMFFRSAIHNSTTLLS